MQQQDLQQISSLLDKKFEENNELLDKKIDKKFEENNKILKGEIIDDIGVIFRQSFNELEAKIDLIDEKVSLAAGKDDKIIKKQQDFDAELAANLGAHNRFEEKFTKTDVRIKAVEEKFKASPVAAQ
ncbi:hypothetical protein KJ863_04190 [Patescibacteria group bacterium]|nr:hypothetical protein [Candidatus Falkowbacteria bacterium]MBU3906570.1 hypothetical protein [Patescibacteria group bacterium]MBU4015774.1 hypothetical protein [Patescibacteria group bacterium]MBU4073279.1 hypothetical protein [Patescibacteria group bacterium]MBU4103273.1 hypothetical protein [Patescibacteria group bacterium]